MKLLPTPSPSNSSFPIEWPLLQQVGLWLDQHAGPQAVRQTQLLGEWGGSILFKKEQLGFPFMCVYVCASACVSMCMSCVRDSDVFCMGMSAFSTTSQAEDQAEENYLGFFVYGWRCHWAFLLTEVMAAFVGEEKGKSNRSCSCWRKQDLFSWVKTQTCRSLGGWIKTTWRSHVGARIWSVTRSLSTHFILELHKVQWAVVHLLLCMHLLIILILLLFFGWVNLSIVRKSKDVQAWMVKSFSSILVSPATQLLPKGL